MQVGFPGPTGSAPGWVIRSSVVSVGVDEKEALVPWWSAASKMSRADGSRVKCAHLPARRDSPPSFVNVSAQEWLCEVDGPVT